MKRLALFLLAALPVLAIHSQDLVTDYYMPGSFPIVSRSMGATAIYVDPQDHWLVGKATALLQQDIERVTGVRPAIITSLAVPMPIRNLIIIGSLDQSAMIKQLARQNMIPSDKLAGKWETFLWKTIRNPVTWVDRTLVIAGSDRRGTAYGIFELSKQMGVSPWYWWADVPVRQKEALFISNRIVEEGPAVKYRGFFINDEAPALSGWARAKFGGLNQHFYERVFELLLRLKANYLWPAMWGNAFNDDDPQNPILASQYGIVMGTSHHEPMLRAQQEWKRYGAGPWNYTTNAPILDSFWKTGIRHMDSHESIVTIGMRGDGDMPMEESSNIALLEKIVHDQREIIRSVTGKDPSATPQSWALYKEVQDYYDKGMRVPDDVTLLLCDDNWGNVRKLPSPGEQPRTGGYGMYYHFDYVGDPRNYKWLNTNPIPRVWEQMHLTKEYGDDRIWIVNVGDIKPMEFPIEFFMDYAWDPNQWPADRLPAYTLAWATRQFGSDHAAAIANILTQYTKFNGRCKPELLSPDTYSLVNYREAEQVVAEYNGLAKEAESIYNQLPASYRSAYYQLVLYPVQACANLNELYVTVAKNRLYAAQGRAATNALAERARTLYDRDSTLARYYNTELSGGKWEHMMDQTHIGYTYWQQPPVNKMPDIKTLDGSASTNPAWGVAVEGSAAWWTGDADSATAILPVFHSYNPADHYIELFNRRSTPFDYTITTGAPWVQISHVKGTIGQQEEVWVTIDWKKAPAGAHTTSLTITGPGGRQVAVKVVADNPPGFQPDKISGFIETDGYVSMEAGHFTNAVATKEIKWQLIPDLGRTLSGVEASPVTAPSVTPGGNSPHLEYDLYLFDTGTVKVQAYFSPILAFNRRSIHYAISFDDEEPQVIDITAGNDVPAAWRRMVSDNIKIMVSAHTIGRPGRHILKFWMVDPAVVLQKIVVDAGGVRPSYLGPPESYRSAKD